MREILISIQPKWCELIASGKKTVEVRKTRPKIETPFKCYIYQTKMRWVYSLLQKLGLYATARRLALDTGKVIGEFVCDRICPICYTLDGLADVVDCNTTCLNTKDFIEYGKGKTLYGWHISDLVIYDKPKELSEFYTRCYSGCDNCKYQSWDYDLGGGKDIICTVSNKKPLKRPFQSWGYVELLKGGAE